MPGDMRTLRRDLVLVAARAIGGRGIEPTDSLIAGWLVANLGFRMTVATAGKYLAVIREEGVEIEVKRRASDIPSESGVHPWRRCCGLQDGGSNANGRDSRGGARSVVRPIRGSRKLTREEEESIEEWRRVARKRVESA